MRRSRLLLLFLLFSGCFDQGDQDPMALPTSRNTTYVGLSQVKSADLDAIQDWIIKLANRVYTFGAIGGVEYDQGAGATAWTQSNDGKVINSTTSAVPRHWEIPLDLPAGMALGQVRLNCKHDVATVGAIRMEVRSRDKTGSVVSTGTVSSAASTSPQTIISDMTGIITTVAGTEYFVDVTAASSMTANRELYSVEVVAVAT